MAIDKPTYKDMEKNKFLESQKRPGQPAVDVIVSNPDEIFSSDLATTATIYNVSAAAADTEYSQILPDGTKSFLIRVRGNGAELKFSFSLGQSASNFISVPRGSSYYRDGLNLSSVTVYFQTDKTSQIIEILSWG